MAEIETLSAFSCRTSVLKMRMSGGSSPWSITACPHAPVTSPQAPASRPWSINARPSRARRMPRGSRAAGDQGATDGDRNAELSNANKSFADHRVTGDPPCSNPRRRATSTQILESTNNHKPYFIKHRTGFCLLGFISDVLTTSLAEERANSRAEKRKFGKAGSRSKIMGREEFLRRRSHGNCPQRW